ncbi:MAG: NAD-dependent epimerase/dehydratase family protein [Nannocystaceae bacterium]
MTPVEPPSKRRILLTGATGYLGANLLRRLLADGEEVRVLLRHGSGSESLAGLEVERVYGDLRDAEAVHAGMRDVTQVYHCAAKTSWVAGNAASRRELFEINVIGTRNVLDAAHRAGVERVVATGSFAAVGSERSDPLLPVNEAVPYDPFARNLPYQTTKAFAEQECWKAAATGLDVVVATPTVLIGPHDYKLSRFGGLLCDFAHQRLRSFAPGGVEFGSIRDICEGHLLAMKSGRCGEKYLLSSEYLTADGLMELFEEVTQVPRPRMRLPGTLMGGFSRVLEAARVSERVRGWASSGIWRLMHLRRHADISKARLELGYTPTGIAPAVREAYEHFVERGMIRFDLARGHRRYPGVFGRA